MNANTDEQVSLANGTEYILQPKREGSPDFMDFYVSRVNTAPGWFVLGRNDAYGKDERGRGLIVRLVARPNVKPRKFKFWNGKFRRGWLLKREAQVVADHLNAIGHVA